VAPDAALSSRCWCQEDVRVKRMTVSPVGRSLCRGFLSGSLARLIALGGKIRKVGEEQGRRKDPARDHSPDGWAMAFLLFFDVC